MAHLLQVPASSPGHLAFRQHFRTGDLSGSASLRGAPLRARRAGAAVTLFRRRGVFAAASKPISEGETVVESDFLVRFGSRVTPVRVIIG